MQKCVWNETNILRLAEWYRNSGEHPRSHPASLSLSLCLSLSVSLPVKRITLAGIGRARRVPAGLHHGQHRPPRPGTSMYLSIYLYTYLYIYIYIYTHKCICIHTYINTSIYIYMYICVYFYIYMYIYKNIYINMCVCVCVYTSSLWSWCAFLKRMGCGTGLEPPLYDA